MKGTTLSALAFVSAAGMAVFGALHDAPFGLYMVAMCLAAGGCMATIA
jgi:hypothetical protein